MAICNNCEFFFLGFCEVHLENVPAASWIKIHNCPDYQTHSNGLAVIKEWLAEDDSAEVRRFLDVFQGIIEIAEDVHADILKKLSPTKREIMSQYYDFDTGERL
jgi:hypothetical protein